MLRTGVKITGNAIFSSFFYVLLINKPTIILIFFTDYLATMFVNFLLRLQVFGYEGVI
jgi:hypothetical protein